MTIRGRLYDNTGCQDEARTKRQLRCCDTQRCLSTANRERGHAEEQKQQKVGVPTQVRLMNVDDKAQRGSVLPQVTLAFQRDMCQT